MKHKMNKISGYYEGKDGVFYDFTHDEIFVLEFESKIYRRDVGYVGNFYRLFDRTQPKHSPLTAVKGMKNVVRLGDQ